jgi:hypothetical protein
VLDIDSQAILIASTSGPGTPYIHTNTIMVKTMSALLILTISLLSTALPSMSALEPRDVDPPDSLTYCSPLEKGEEQYYIPCTKTSDPISEVQFQMPYLVNSTFNDGRFAAHFECYVETIIGWVPFSSMLS